jgi:hypothetical protein
MLALFCIVILKSEQENCRFKPMVAIVNLYSQNPTFYAQYPNMMLMKNFKIIFLLGSFQNPQPALLKTRVIERGGKPCPQKP